MGSSVPGNGEPVLDDPQWQLPDAVQQHLGHTRRGGPAPGGIIKEPVDQP